MLQFLIVTLLLLQTPPATRPASVHWQFKKGTEFFIEETQKQLLQLKQPTNASSYYDVTYLWRYYVQQQQGNTVTLEATLEKIRVNNPNESGGKASETIKLKEGTKSTWLLRKEPAGWKAEPLLPGSTKHSIPYVLTLGTSKLPEDTGTWKQQWTMRLDNWGQAQIELTILVKQVRDDRLLISSKAHLGWEPEPGTDNKITVHPHSLPSSGLAEFDFSKGRWNTFEFRVDGQWTATRGSATVTMRQDLYCHYRVSERRPVFP